MSDLVIMQLAARQADWLVARQKVVAQNIANSDTPGFKAADIRPFSEVLDMSGTALATTNAGHMNIDRNLSTAIIKKEAASWDVSHSGNSVSLDQQMLKANDIRNAYTLNANIVRSFNRMFLECVKS